MSTAEPDSTPRPVRVRREPPRFRRVTVKRVERVSPRLVRVTLGGAELAGFHVDEPAASVRVLLADGDELVMPAWNGNEFLLPGGSRPAIRTFTPRRVDTVRHGLDIEAVIHGSGPASRWATNAAPGAEVAVSGPGRGYTIDGDARAFLVAGDESALPAISELLEVLPRDVPVAVHIEIADPGARIALPDHACASVAWHDAVAGAPPGTALVTAVRDAPLADGVRVWAAGEAAAMQRIRRFLFDERALLRAHTTVRGYWKAGRAGDDE